ncbi:protein of unknown function [Sterolibacterium denitrificans]|uniref:Uncharacterized protein n=1 Tax=Sterolibacterium denitrificans TaxID=157592 RepID=A0A7Z7MUM3_9PROT|nr:protein of unknown function [Sterolibacterium denitrificans]
MEPPRTLMHWTDRAPVLSATVNLLCICIIKFLQLNSRDKRFAISLGTHPGQKAPQACGALVATKSAIMYGSKPFVNAC